MSRTPAADQRSTHLLPALAAEVTRSVRALHALKAQITRSDDESERAAHTVLLLLAHTGEQRASALAERLCADSSTVSRQTGELVRRGLLERHRDPDDGRAWRLAVTPAGQQVVDAVLERRQERFARAVEDWSDGDLDTFVALLARFTDGLELVRGTTPTEQEHA